MSLCGVTGRWRRATRLQVGPPGMRQQMGRRAGSSVSWTRLTGGAMYALSRVGRSAQISSWGSGGLTSLLAPEHKSTTYPDGSRDRLSRSLCCVLQSMCHTRGESIISFFLSFPPPPASCLKMTGFEVREAEHTLCVDFTGLLTCLGP